MAYTLLASPTLYPGQTVRASVSADPGNPAPIATRLFLRHYDGADELAPASGPDTVLGPGNTRELTWRIPEVDSQPIAQIGLEIRPGSGSSGTLYLDLLTWEGAPDMRLGRPEGGGTMWRRAWVNGVDQFEDRWPEPYRIVQNRGTGLLIQGTQEWADYRISAPVTVHLAKSAGIAARVGGLRRYYALLLCDDGKVRLIKALDGDTILGEIDFPCEVRRPYTLALTVTGDRIEARIDDAPLFDVRDAERPLLTGSIALVCEEGCLASEAVTVRPAG